jgi:hypothetical protein
LGVPRQFQKLNALVQVGFIGVLVPVDLALAAVLLLAPLVRHFIEEGRIYEAVELVDINGVNAILKPLVFGCRLIASSCSRRTVAGQRKTRFRGLPRVRWAFTFAMAAYNLIRLPKLLGAIVA